MTDTDKVKCHKLSSLIIKWKRGKKGHAEVIKEANEIINDIDNDPVQKLANELGMA